MAVITIDKDACTGCGTCVSVCPEEVFEIGEDGKAEAKYPDRCTGCCSCVGSCPAGAITNDMCQ